jgi:ABC-type uncharacterized transport system permease subunit
VQRVAQATGDHAVRARSEAIAFVIMACALVIAPMFAYPVFLMKALCFALFACAFNLLIGYVGLLSFGHALFFGWASYVGAHAAKVWGFPPELAILSGTATGAGLGAIVGALAIRRQGIYFAMITLALAQMMYFFAIQAPFTHGEDGIQAVPRGKLFGLIDLANQTNMYVTVLVIFLGCFLLIYRIINSPFGEVLKAIRENEARAVSLGYRTERYKLVAFVLSATFAGGGRGDQGAGLPTCLLDRRRLADVGGSHSHDAGRRPWHPVRAGRRRVFHGDAGKLPDHDRPMGVRRPGRDFRGLRVAVPPRHRRRTRQVLRIKLDGAGPLSAATGARTLQPTPYGLALPRLMGYKDCKSSIFVVVSCAGAAA